MKDERGCMPRRCLLLFLFLLPVVEAMVDDTNLSFSNEKEVWNIYHDRQSTKIAGSCGGPEQTTGRMWKRRLLVWSPIHSPSSESSPRRTGSGHLFPSWALLLFLVMVCPSVSAFSLPSVPSRQSLRHWRPSPSSSTTQLAADLSFSGDSRASIQVKEMLNASLQEWLDTPEASDLTLLGSELMKQSGGDSTLWECQQPRIDFMGLDLQPTFTQRLKRNNGVVTVQVLDSRTDILSNNNPANQVVGSLMSLAKFAGQSVIRVQKSTSSGPNRSILQVDLTLTLKVPLPPFILLPPGFNSVGSSVVKRTGDSRTKQLLDDLNNAYQKWAKAKVISASTNNTSSSTDQEQGVNK